jgi:hypothetical protein
VGRTDEEVTNESARLTIVCTRRCGTASTECWDGRLERGHGYVPAQGQGRVQISARLARHGRGAQPGRGIDPSTVKFDAAGETRSERIQAKADSAREKAKPSQTEKMTELLGDERPDIVAAAALQRPLFGYRAFSVPACHAWSCKLGEPIAMRCAGSAVV